MASTNIDPQTPGSSRVQRNTEHTGKIRLLSIVTTVFRSEKTIAEFAKRALAVAEGVANEVELIVVDDGSPDRSAELVRDLADLDSRVVLVQLSKNFGHHRALLTGLEHAKGDMVFLLDSDLEEAPENLAPMLAEMRAAKADCVYGVQNVRKGGWFERTSGELFYKLFGILSDVELPRNVSTVRVMSKRYVNSLLLFRDQNPVLVPLTLITGYRQVPYRFDKRSLTPTTYSIRKRLGMLVLYVTSFSGRPLYMMFAFSIVLASVGILFGAYVILKALTGPVQSGWSSLMATIIFFFSLNALFTGIIGLYLKRILEEVKDRPRTIVQEVYRKSVEKREAEHG